MVHSEVIIVPSLFFMIGFIVWITISGWQRRQRMKLVTDFHTRLLDRLGSVKDFNEFIHTEAGAQFMNSIGTEPETSGPHERILRATQIGIVALSLGIGLFSIGRFGSFEDAVSRQGFVTLGIIVLSLGIGFVVSAAVSYRLASTLGVLRPATLRAPQTVR